MHGVSRPSKNIGVKGTKQRPTVGHPRVTMGHLWLTIGYLKASVVHIRVTLGHLRVTIGYFFLYSKHKANTTEL